MNYLKSLRTYKDYKNWEQSPAVERAEENIDDGIACATETRILSCFNVTSGPLAIRSIQT